MSHKRVPLTPLRKVWGQGPLWYPGWFTVSFSGFMPTIPVSSHLACGQPSSISCTYLLNPPLPPLKSLPFLTNASSNAGLLFLRLPLEGFPQRAQAEGRFQSTGSGFINPFIAWLYILQMLDWMHKQGHYCQKSMNKASLVVR